MNRKRKKHPPSEKVDTAPFSLGYEGERWDGRVPGVFIPLNSKDMGALVIRSEKGGYAVVTTKSWDECEDILMASALVAKLIEEDKENENLHD